MSFLNRDYTNRTVDGAHVSFMTNTSIAAGPVLLSQVYVTITVHVSRTCLLCGGMLYNRMEGDERRVKWGVDRHQCLSVPLDRITRTPVMTVQSLSVILINGISRLLQ